MTAADIKPTAMATTAKHVEESAFDQKAAAQATQEKPWQAVFKHPKLLMYAMLINIGPLLFGYDMVIIGAVSALPQFKIDFGERTGSSLVIPALWVALWNSFLQLGNGAGSFLAGSFQDRFGRRATVFVGGVLGCIGAAVSYVSCYPTAMLERRVSFMFAKFILGASSAFLMTSCQTWISETTPPDLRGVFLGFYGFNVAFGHLIAIAVVFGLSVGVNRASYQIPFASQWAFGGWAMVVAWILPESPVWLASRDRIEKAQRSVKRIGIEHMLPQMLRTIEAEREENTTREGGPTYRECFQGTNQRRTLLAIFLTSIQQCIGMSLIANAAYFLTMAGMSSRYSLMVNLIGISSSMVACMFSWYSVPRFGRRRMILISTFLDIMAWLAMGIAGCFSTAAASWLVGVGLVLVGFFNSLGVASAVPVIQSEISTVRLRSKTAGIAFTSQALTMWAFNFFTPYMYNIDQLNWGGKIGFFFVGLGGIAFVVGWFAIPETKGRTFAEIDHLFESGVKHRVFHKTNIGLVEDSDIITGKKAF
ncbi:MFS transporter SP family general alpha glucoside:H+ symporter [Microdochium nivale]|nr:MFS transporter SP family general alpha glucoside:H+ symporter [Microdochium nivale]